MIKQSMHLAAIFLLVTAGSTVYAAADGKQVYEDTCAACHDSGKKGAPMLDDTEDWSDFLPVVWTDVHNAHMDDGFLGAPGDAKDGVTDEEMEAAVNYIVSTVSKN